MQVPETVKHHPYAWGAGAFLVLVIIFYWLFGSSSSSSASSGADPNAAYYGAEALAAQSSAAASAQQDQVSAGVAVAQLQATTAQAAIAANQESTDLATTTGATTADDYINGLVALGNTNSNNALLAQNYGTATAFNLADLSVNPAEAGSSSFGQFLDTLPINPTTTAQNQTYTNFWFGTDLGGLNPAGLNVVGNANQGGNSPLSFAPPTPAPAVSGPVQITLPLPAPASNNNTPISALTTIGATMAA